MKSSSIFHVHLQKEFSIVPKILSCCSSKLFSLFLICRGKIDLKVVINNFFHENFSWDTKHYLVVEIFDFFLFLNLKKTEGCIKKCFGGFQIHVILNVMKKKPFQVNCNLWCGNWSLKLHWNIRHTHKMWNNKNH